MPKTATKWTTCVHSQTCWSKRVDTLERQRSLVRHIAGNNMLVLVYLYKYTSCKTIMFILSPRMQDDLAAISFPADYEIG